MGNIIVVGDHEMVRGFSLLGVRDCLVAKKENAEEQLSKAFSSEDAGLIILLADFVPALSYKMKKKIDSSSKPVVVVIPGKSGAAGTSGDLQRMIKRAIGVDLKN